MTFSAIFSQTLAVIALFGNAIILLLLACLFLFKNNGSGQKIINFFGKRALPFSLLIAAGATLGSLVYSEVLNFPPCPLCWYQRVFMYPLVVILIVASVRKENVGHYAIPLASIGGLFSLYHYSLEWGLIPSAFCGAEALSCAQRLVFEFGFVSLPWMTLTTFLLIILFFVAKKHVRE